MDEVVDHYDIRRAVETFVARQLAGQLSQDQVRQLEANLKAQKACAERDDKAHYARLDADFHLALCRFHGNREIEKVMLRLRDKVFGVVARAYQSPGRLTTSYEEHKGVLEALASGEGDLAAERMEEHLLFGKRFLVSR